MLYGTYFLSLGNGLFFLSLLLLYINRRNLIITLVSFELLSIGLSILFITNSIWINDLNGQVFALLILIVSGAESAIALSLFLAHFRSSGSITAMSLRQLKG